MNSPSYLRHAYRNIDDVRRLKLLCRLAAIEIETLVGAEGIEPSTSAVSRRRSPAELSTLLGSSAPVDDEISPTGTGA